MEELEKIIAVCADQLKKLKVVNSKLSSSISVLAKDIFTEERRIVQGVIAIAKEVQTTKALPPATDTFAA